MSTLVHIVKLKSSNYRSVQQAVIAGGGGVTPKIIEIIELKDSSILIIPGIGNMASLVSEVSENLDIERIRNYIISHNIKVIGICLGFQWLCSKSFESEHSKCLNLINCTVESIFTPTMPSLGWKRLKESIFNKNTSSLSNYIKGKDFYLTHSFGVGDLELKGAEVYVYSSDEANNLVAAVISKNIIGYQFHPEKSGQHGVKLLQKPILYLESN